MRVAPLTLGLILLLGPLEGPGWAYPGFIGLGYNSCTACHYNPAGGGPLTDYGRALAATEISGKLFVKKLSDEKLAENSGFLGPWGTLPPWLRLAFGFRELFLVTDLFQDPSTRWITMQTDGSVILQTEDNRYFAVATLGYIPVPETLSPALREETPSLISREHYLAFQPNASLGFYLGFMDAVFGVRISDHNAYIRSKTLLNQNDQVHAFMFHFATKKWEGFVQAFMGNLYQTSSVRQQGATTMVEFEPAEKIRVGLSGWASKSDYRSRQMAAGHLRMGLEGASAILAEVGLAQETPVGGTGKWGDFVYLQTMSRITQGLYVLMNFEHFREDLSTESPSLYRAGPGVQYFPVQRLEFEVDLFGGHTTGSTILTQDVFTLLTQIHVYL